MTKFNPDNKKNLTVGECLSPAMEIVDPEVAKQYLKDYISYLESNHAWTTEESNRILIGDFTYWESVAKRNIGYYAGYYDDETRKRVEKLFDCEHPLFGKIAEMGTPTTDEAYQCGYERKTLAEIRAQK